MNQSNTQSFFLNTFATCIILSLVLILFTFFAPRYVSPNIASKLAKKTENIKSDGCLRSLGRRKYALLYSLNGQTGSNIQKLIIKNSPFAHKWNSHSRDLLSNFQQNNSSQCLKVKYVTVNLWVISSDYLYDIDEL